MPEITTLRNLAIIFMFVVLLGTAAFDKITSGPTPDWFIKQFSNTFIAKMPGGASAGYWFIAAFETILTLAFISALMHGDFVAGASVTLLSYALIGSLFLFAMLCFGLRITNDFQGSANMFTYFGVSLLSLYLISP